MPIVQTRLEIHPLCHVHHAHMIHYYIFVGADGSRSEISAYACPEAGCFFHYNDSHGYFILSQNGDGIKTDSLMPRVRCEKDEMPMYLAEVLPGKRSFRLWKCPTCNMNRAVNSDAQ